MVTFIIIILFAVGLLGLVKTTLDLMRGIDSEGWPKVECIITEASYSWKLRSGNFESYYSPIIEYTYTYETHLFNGRKIRFGPPMFFATQDEIELFMAEYKKGKMYELSVNPKNPKLSVLQSGVKSYHYWLVLLNLAVLIAGTFLYLFFG